MSKIVNISIETSDNFTQYQMDQTFKALRNINKAQEEAYAKAIQEAKNS